MKIIDSHAHIYPEKIAEKASQSISDFYDMKTKYDGTITKLLELCAESNVSKCVVCSVATSPLQVKSINDFIAVSSTSYRVSGNNNTPKQVEFAGLCTLHPDMSENEVYDELSRAKTLGLKGIKLHPDFQQFKTNDKRAYKIYAAAENFMPILFHTGDRRYDYSNPTELCEVLRSFPGLTAIGAHFGGWSVWDDVHCLAKHENFHIDTSSSLYELPAERAKALINLFGAQRVLFGTDYPMWDAKGEIELIEQLELTDSEKDLIFYKNAEKIYNLADSQPPVA